MEMFSNPGVQSSESDIFLNNLELKVGVSDDVKGSYAHDEQNDVIIQEDPEKENKLESSNDDHDQNL